MPPFFESLIKSLGDLGLELVETIVEPKDIVKDYSLYSLPIIVIFIFSKSLAVVYYKIRNAISPEQIEDSTKRGFVSVHLFFLTTISIIVMYLKCAKDDYIDIRFSLIFQQSILTVVPLYLLLFFFQKLSFYNRVREAFPNILSNLIEGAIIFVFFNWAMNFRDKFKYNRCNTISDWDIESRILEMQKQAILEGNDKVGYIPSKHKESDVSSVVKSRVSVDGSGVEKVIVGTGAVGTQSSKDISKEHDDPSDLGFVKSSDSDDDDDDDDTGADNVESSKKDDDKKKDEDSSGIPSSMGIGFFIAGILMMALFFYMFIKGRLLYRREKKNKKKRMKNRKKNEKLLSGLLTLLSGKTLSADEKSASSSASGSDSVGDEKDDQ